MVGGKFIQSTKALFQPIWPSLHIVHRSSFCNLLVYAIKYICSFSLVIKFTVKLLRPDSFPLFVWMQNVQEAERPLEGFYIRSGITVVLKNAVIPDGTVI